MKDLFLWQSKLNQNLGGLSAEPGGAGEHRRRTEEKAGRESAHGPSRDVGQRVGHPHPERVVADVADVFAEPRRLDGSLRLGLG